MRSPQRVIFAAVALVGVALPHSLGADPGRTTDGPRGGAAGILAPGGLLGGFALAADRGPVKIKAQALEFDYRTHVLTYRGEVSVRQADMTLRSDVLRMKLDPDVPEGLREVVAEGAVRIEVGGRVATGGRAVFDQAAQTIVLSDEATLHDGPNEVAGERVVVYLGEERSVVEGGDGRVRAVLFPSDGELQRSLGDAGVESE